MKVSIIYHSKFGNNEKMADYLADLFTSADVSVYNVKEHNPKHIVHSDLYIFCTPTHMGNAPFKIRGFIKKIKPEHKTRAAIIATYINQKTKALSTIKDKLDNNFTIIKEFKIKSTDLKGPLEDNWQNKLKDFYKSLLTL